MSSLNAVFQRTTQAGRPAFIPFVTAGDPTLQDTSRVIETLVGAGADIIEIGFPYSDPLADGPVIQASYTRALAAGAKLSRIFQSVGHWTKQFPQTPFVAMSSYALVHRQSPFVFLDQAKQAGFAGIIIPDLPLEEAPAAAQLARERGLAFIQLVTPTTPPERAAEIAKNTTGFLYVVSVTGITGMREALPVELANQLSRLRAITKLPLCVGFGISTPQQAKMLQGQADGIIVGSALVRCLEGDRSFEKKLTQLGELASSLVRAG